MVLVGMVLVGMVLVGMVLVGMVLVSPVLGRRLPPCRIQLGTAGQTDRRPGLESAP
jgi:hypothetical protein